MRAGSDVTSAEHLDSELAGPIVFAYDGTALAASAIAQAGGLLEKTRDALVVCVWHPVDVGFTPSDPRHLDADRADDVGRAAEATAQQGAMLAEKAGFRAKALAIEASPAWKGILDTADEHHAAVIVLGSAVSRHRLVGHLFGSVASAVGSHSSIPVLILPHP